jgi:hypothetical protein
MTENENSLLEDKDDSDDELFDGYKRDVLDDDPEIMY